MTIQLKKCLPDAACVVLFALIAFAYFSPAVLDGRRLYGHDHSANDGVAVEMDHYRQAHGGATPRWVNCIFGGMPTYQIAPSYTSTHTLSQLADAYHLFMPDYVWYVFASMLGFYILLRALKLRNWQAALGAVMWAFSTYFLIIIQAGHIWKVITLAYIPPTLGGIILTYRGRYLWGGVTTALFAALQISGNHVQMTYYFLLPTLLIVLALLVRAVRCRELPRFLRATAVTAAAAALAVCVNLSNLYHTYTYAAHTMRGASELVKPGQAHNQTSSGLDRDYITQWSYGVDETLTLLIPDFRGGASTPLADDPALMRRADSQINPQVYGYFTQYFGEQPMTAGPVYAGAAVMLLFALGLILLPRRDPLKWALVTATVLSVALAWGHNFQALTDLFIDHVPLYAKFRTVSSILVVAEMTIPLLAILGLRQFCRLATSTAADRKRALSALTWSTAILALTAALFALNPEGWWGECVSSRDRELTAQLTADPAMQQALLGSLSRMREGMVTSDAWRSCLIILAAAALLWQYHYRARSHQPRANVLAILMLALVLGDLWSVNKRYLNDSHFTFPDQEESAEPTAAEAYILQNEKSLGYRVFDQANFTNNRTARHFRSVGGYNAAKLRRYQELLDAHVTGGELHKSVLDMLNTRWMLLTQDGRQVPVPNPSAYGPAWYASRIHTVRSANEELDALADTLLREQAVLTPGEQAVLGHPTATAPEPGDTIILTSITSDQLTYTTHSRRGGLAVFSEIYYPGWRATIDGREVPIARADYILRSLVIPAGDHQVQMTFRPGSIAATETIAITALVLLLLALLAATARTLLRRDKPQSESESAGSAKN